MSVFDGKSPRSHVWVCLLGSWGVNILFTAMTDGFQGDAILALLLLIAILGAWAVVAIRRLNDLQRSRWWAIGLLVPILNIALTLGLLFRKGIAAVPETEKSVNGT